MSNYAQTPFVKKLGIKPGSTMYIAGAPVNYFDWVYPLPEDVIVIKTLGKTLDFIHLFALTQKDFYKAFDNAKKHLEKDGMIWISWPKKLSNIPSDLNENIIRAYGLEQGLVDVKVCAVDEVWSALKFVYRLMDR